MADINQRIKKISKYFIGMKVDKLNDDSYIYVNVKFPSKWSVNKQEILDNFGVTVGMDNGGIYYFVADISDGFDVIFDAIDNIIEKMSIIEERNALFKQKIENLRELFENNDIPIESLRTLEFKYKQPKKKKDIPKKEEDVIENENNENTNE